MRGRKSENLTNTMTCQICGQTTFLYLFCISHNQTRPKHFCYITYYCLITKVRDVSELIEIRGIKTRTNQNNVSRVLITIEKLKMHSELIIGPKSEYEKEEKEGERFDQYCRDETVKQIPHYSQYLYIKLCSLCF